MGKGQDPGKKIDFGPTKKEKPVRQTDMAWCLIETDLGIILDGKTIEGLYVKQERGKKKEASRVSQSDVQHRRERMTSALISINHMY